VCDWHAWWKWFRTASRLMREYGFCGFIVG
jgi:hypothetical protein